MIEQNAILSVAFFPPVEYFTVILKYAHLFIEDAENYRKQSYRNRTNILTANGIQSLAVPVCHVSNHTPIRDVKIEYRTDWQRKYWKAIESAYNNSPFFLYYRDFFIPFFQKKYSYLFDYNIEIVEVLLKLIDKDRSISFTETYNKDYSTEHDYREVIQPKRATKENYPFALTKSYTQVFDNKFGFTPNLSILDLLFNQGNQTTEYLLL